MEKGDLVAAVSRIVMDDSYDDEDITAILNRGVLEIAGGGDTSRRLPKLAPLPDLFTSDDISVTTSSTAMPLDYHRGLLLVYDENGDELKKAGSFIQLTRKFANSGEDIPKEYVLMGNTLKTQPVPAASTDLTLHYYRRPVDMSADSDTPDGIPEHLHNRLLVNFACKELFNEIEQGTDGRMPNREKHYNEYLKALDDLSREVGIEERDPVYAMDVDE